MTRKSSIIRFLSVVFLLGSACAFGQTLTTLYNFGSSNQDGADPEPGVVFDQAGNLFGMASLGTSNGNGMIFELTPTGGGSWTQTVVHKFHGSPDGEQPLGRPLVTASGKIFGTASRGGANNQGTVFAVFPPDAPGDPWTGRVLYTFGSVSGDGITPNAGLIGAHGSLYGVTREGGATGRGTVFQLTPAADPSAPWTENILHSFTAGGDAAFPSSELVMDSSGNLFGTALQGGVNNLGAVYQVSPPAVPGGAWTETVVYSFNGDDGTLPFGRLRFDASGALYGTTDGGGSKQEGTVFKLTPPEHSGDDWTESIIFNFSGGRDGGNPTAGVTMDGTGRLYGTASTGGAGGPDFGGVVFVLDPPTTPGGSWTETILHHFGGPDGFSPVSPVVLRQGRIYGTTMLGGTFGKGTAFVLTP